MTPLQIEMLLHYNCRASDFREGDFSAPAVREAIDWFISEEVAVLRSTQGTGDTAYVLTEKGKVFVQALCTLPLPIQHWAMPWAQLAQQQGAQQ